MAGLSAERFGQQHPPRPHMQSQTSSSVPSTPSQQPRDLRFHSRSPSPNRGLGNQSPRSVVSEQVGQTIMQRGAPVVCKFETGAEFRKRRIPYVEGGNEELGPAKKELKKTLQPDEEDKLSGDMRELYDRLLPSDESEQRRAQLIKKLEKMMNDEWPGNDIRVNVFGSSGNLLSSSDSDVDICVTTPLKKLESMHSLATLLHRHGMEKVVCRASAKVPIVKCWDPELRLACDLNVNNPLALENTRMIKTYVQLDDRVRPLAKIIKYWSKRRILNDAAFGGTISSYTWICMILSFLQRRDPPIIPSLQKVEGKRLNCTERKEASRFADDIEALRGCGDANKETLAQLLFHFFRHYGYEFEYSRYVVSVKEGRLLSREEKGWQTSNYSEKEARNRLCVEEPFTTNRNLGNSADDYAWSGVHAEIRRAFELLADGQQLEKCCEQYEFPPEEKPVFQRPAPKPAPTLRRSASQSGRPNNPEQGSGRSRKSNNRNQSAQRAGSRRASSGASFGNPRMTYPLQSPPVGSHVQSSMDYFAAKGNLHEHLYYQYQALQAQQDALRAQLQHQQQQGQGQPQRVGDLTGSPHHRGGASQNGLASPRFLDNPPQTAPLLPGYLYHYPARYPPPSPMSQARSREGTSTKPSSPSLVAAVPALRRQIHRASVPEGSTSSARSQSQPGRSLPHAFTLQQQAHPGYDVSGAIPGPHHSLRSSQMYAQGQHGLQLPYSPALATMQGLNGSMDSAMPKEYMGYIISSPQLGPQVGPQQQYASAPQMPQQPMTLQNPPARTRRVTPDLQPPLPNGRHISRSPSPLGHLRSYSTTSDLRSTAQSNALQSPLSYEAAIPATVPAPAEMDIGGPLIVNGSTPLLQKPAERVNGLPASGQTDGMNGKLEHDLSRVRSMPIRTSNLDGYEATERLETSERTPASPRISPSPRGKAGPRLNLSPNGQGTNGFHEVFHEPAPLTAPLLSPVAELRTPSPTQAHVFDRQESPQKNGLVKAANIASANAKQAERGENELPAPALYTKHERKGSAPNPSAPGKSAKSPTTLTPASALRDQNPWQQVQGARKGHKKSKSTNANAPKSAGGQPLPANESERKGG